MTKYMDGAFRAAMLKAALQSNRVERAKEQAVRIVEMLYPDMDEFEVEWPDDDKEQAQSEVGDAANE
jgi:hypothetical protein